MGPSTCVQCQCGKCSKALSGFQYQTQDVKTKHEKKYPLVSLSVPKRVSLVMPANSPGVEDGVDGPKRQQQDLDHNGRGASPAGMDRRAGAELEEVRDNASKGLVDWDQDEHDFDFDYMQSFDNENLLDHQPAHLVLSPPRTPSPQLQNPPQTDPHPRQSPPQIAPHPNLPPPLLDNEVFEPLGDPGVPPPGSDQAQADHLNLLPIAFQETPAV